MHHHQQNDIQHCRFPYISSLSKRTRWTDHIRRNVKCVCHFVLQTMYTFAYQLPYKTFSKISKNRRNAKRLKLHEPFLFPADVDCHCTVESQDGKDLNIMYERERCNGFVSILDGENTSTQVPCGTSETIVVKISIPEHLLLVQFFFDSK